MRNEGAGDLALRLALIQVSAVGVALPVIVPQTHEVEP